MLGILGGLLSRPRQLGIPGSLLFLAPRVEGHACAQPNVSSGLVGAWFPASLPMYLIGLLCGFPSGVAEGEVINGGGG